MKKLIRVISVMLVMLMLASCSNSNPDEKFYEEYPTGDEIITVAIEKNPIAELELTDGSEIIIELRYDIAPNAVANFIAFANEGLYEKMGFSQVRNNCIVMTDYIQDGASTPYYAVDEIQDSEDAERLSHIRGTVSMIRTSQSDTLTGKFFILTKDQEHFDSYCTAFGTVTEGLENIDKLVSLEKDDNGCLTEPVGIKKVKIKTFGVDFPLPTIILK